VIVVGPGGEVKLIESPSLDGIREAIAEVE
jgi:hypothetical protein